MGDRKQLLRTGIPIADAIGRKRFADIKEYIVLRNFITL